MIYLSGGSVRRPELVGPNLGLMLTPMQGQSPGPRSLWAADTGCFAQPQKHDDEKYLTWLARNDAHQLRCLFATAPDVVGDAEATLARSAAMLPEIRALGYRAALVAQDGLERLEVPWDEFDCLFIGGTTHWKLSEAAYELAREADERGKWTHMGRVNSWRRLKAAAVSGYDSADGTYLRFGTDVLLPQLQGWIENLRQQQPLEVVG